MAAGFISEWWPASNRNGGRLHVGIPGRNKSESAIKDTNHVKHLRAIAEIFELLGLQSKAAPAVAEFLEEKKHVVQDIVDDELNNWGLQVADVEDGEMDS